MAVDTCIHVSVDEYCADPNFGMSKEDFIAEVKRDDPEALVEYNGNYYYAVMGGGPGELEITELRNGYVAFKCLPELDSPEPERHYAFYYNSSGNTITITKVVGELSHLAAGAVLTRIE